MNDYWNYIRYYFYSLLNLSYDNNYLYYDNGDGTATLAMYIGNDTEIVAPKRIGGKRVTAIDVTCYNYSNITSLTIPNTVTTIY